MSEENRHTTYTITAHRCPDISSSPRVVGKTFTADRDIAVATIGAFAEQLGTGRVDTNAAVKATIEKADQYGQGRLTRDGGFIVVDALYEAIITARPAVAMVSSPGSIHPSIHLGYWQDDGEWADADLGPGAGTLLEAVGDALRECEQQRLGHSSVSVVCQSFTGELTETYTYRPGFPEVGMADMPTDPEVKD